ncbi:MAG: hypothetical protein MJ147_02425 [Clostridia bacterium]|nr:hypothetical protein [Clostridia bacterium]
MKKFIAKTFSFILALIIILSSFAVCLPVFAESTVQPGTDIPLIYIPGQGAPLFRYENGVKKEEVYPVKYDTDEIVQIAKDNIDVFAKAVVTQKWTDFGNLIRDVLNPMFSELALDENGHTKDNIASHPVYTELQIKNRKKVNGKYATRAFTFNYDWRLDPWEVADSLHKFISDVVRITGYDHVAISGRCEGSCIAAAYMEKYDGEYISDFISYASALNGTDIISKTFAGNIDLSADAVERFVHDLNISADEVVNKLVNASITLLNKMNIIDLACLSVNNVWDKIYLDIMPQILIESFGTWPGFWCMVSDKDYDRAKANVFHNADMEKLANFIDIIDNYHYKVQVKAPQHFRSYAEKGIEIYNITKYGFQHIPLSKPDDVLSDSYVTVFDGSMGATTATLNKTLSRKYIARAKELGTYKYISPDKQIDASTCLFPDKTWFIKNISHKEFPTDADRLVDAMVNIDNLTIDKKEEFPQYLVFTDEKLVPMTEENMDTTTEKYKISFFKALRNLFEALIAYIKQNKSK